MNTSKFIECKARFCTVISQTLLDESTYGSLEKAAFLAYTHANPVINLLFWQRLRKVINYLETHAPYEVALDFGCGGGVMLSFLAGVSKRVLAMDIDLAAFESIRTHLEFPDNIEAYYLGDTPLGKMIPASVDVVVALDVLEHIDDLGNTLTDLYRLLKPTGKMVVSGPTENIIYEIGRRLAGPEYTGDYHSRDIYDIKKELSKQMKIKRIASLYYPIPLFEVFVGQPVS